jgi:hypothetical protein
MKNLRDIIQISTTTIFPYLVITALCGDGTIWVKKGTEDWVCFNDKD